jgi:hypothetical protein
MNKNSIIFVIFIWFSFSTNYSLSDDSIENSNDENEDNLSVNKESEQILYSTPNIDNYYIYEHFDEELEFNQRWTKSESSKDSQQLKYDGEWGLTHTQQSIKGLI